MEAVTIRPEWTWAIRFAGCRVVAKDFFPEAIEGRRIALHAGAHVGGHAGRPAGFAGLQEIAHAADLYRLPLAMVPFFDPDREPCLAVRRSFEPAGVVFRACDFDRNLVFGTAQVQRPSSFREFAWAVPGRVHWQLVDVQLLATPIPCEGAQGIWRVPPGIAQQIIAAQPHMAAQESR